TAAGVGRSWTAVGAGRSAGEVRYELTLFSFFFQSYRDLRDLHSFPTRRSSDLVLREMPECEFEIVGADLPTELLKGVPGVIRYLDRKSTRLNSSHDQISYAVFCLKKKKKKKTHTNMPNTYTAD